MQQRTHSLVEATSNVGLSYVKYIVFLSVLPLLNMSSTSGNFLAAALLAAISFLQHYFVRRGFSWYTKHHRRIIKQRKKWKKYQKRHGLTNKKLLIEEITYDLYYTKKLSNKNYSILYNNIRSYSPMGYM